MRGISETEDRRRGCLDTIGVQDPFLQGLEFRCAGGFSAMVARYCDIDDAARGDIVGEENGREFDLARGTGN